MYCRAFSFKTGLLVLSLGVGCTGKPSRLDPPEIPADAGEQAVSKYDANSDGSIGGDELAKAPALKASLARLDKNGDSLVSAEEINGRIEAWRKSRVALSRVAATVKRDGRPVPSATVTLAPEPFLGAAVKAARGVTNGSGTAHLEISKDPDERGVHQGFYRVEVTMAGADGKEQIPARFNAETEVGVEIAPDVPSSDQVMINISGK